MATTAPRALSGKFVCLVKICIGCFYERLAEEARFIYISPMNCEQVLKILRTNEGALRAQGVLHAALFGSTARGKEHSKSDIDLLIDLDPQADLGVFEYAALTQFINELFPQPVDIANHASLKPHVRPHAERDALNAF